MTEKHDNMTTAHDTAPISRKPGNASQEKPVKITISGLNFFYGRHQILDNINASFVENEITAITGPSGVGKSTFLSVLNRLWETVPQASVTGEVWITLDGRRRNINHPSFPVTHLRRRVGMVFQAPNPLPMSIYKNVAFPLKLAGITRRPEVEKRVVRAIEAAGLWQEVKSRLHGSAFSLSGGQQQRLCMARALVLEPEVLLLDEPTSSLDEAAAAVIEELMVSLKKRCTIVMVSHNRQQVERVADHRLVFPGT